MTIRQLGLNLAGWAAIVLGAVAFPATGSTPTAPSFVVSPQWVKMPAGLVFGEVSAVDVDTNDQVWVLQRPRTANPSPDQRVAPPIMVFDHDGNYLRGFGGPGASYDWPQNEHSLAVDARGRVWITGNSRNTDDTLLTFDGDGRFLRQIGRPGATRGGRDVGNLYAPADIFVDVAKHDVYVADGYGNRRVIVFDSETGAFKRMWSAFGAPPPLDPAPDPRKPGQAYNPESGKGPAGFNGVHGVEVSHDGLVYVSDRNNQRIQVFTEAGRYLRQVFVDRNEASPQTASGMAFSPDKDQRYLYVADFGNARVLIVNRRSLKVIGTVGGGKGSGPGEFIGPHLMATDHQGNLYVADVPGRRLQRFVLATAR